MNICQISSLDFLHCLQSDRPSSMSFFQQVLTIAEEDHLVTISDYAIAQFLEKSLRPIDQKRLEVLLDTIDIWQTDATDYDSALDLSENQGIALADAIDHIIFGHLCPDWILVAESPRDLPNATAIQSFWQDWQAIRDDFPPDGGISPGFPTGGDGGGSPSGTANNTTRADASYPAKQTPTQDTAINSSVIFNQNSYVNLSWSLLSSTASTTPSSTPISLSENRPLAAIQLAQAIQDSLPALEVQLQPTAQGWEIVIELPSGQPVKTITLAELAADQRTVINQIQAQVQPQDPLIPVANPTDAIQPLVQQLVAVQATANNDVIYINNSNTPIDAGPGVDLVSFRNATAGITINLSAEQPLQNVENIEGSQFDDQLSGDQNDNVIIALAGNDTVIGDDGNDVLRSDAGNNLLIGGRSNNNLTIPSPIDAVPESITGEPDQLDTSSPSDFTLVGLPADKSQNSTERSAQLDRASVSDNDWIFAGTGDDVINAGTGNNFIDAGTGNNRIYSGQGKDLFVLEVGSGITRILNYQQHDKFGLLGGYSYDDLVLSDTQGKQIGTKIQLKSTDQANGDVLAIVLGVSLQQLDRSDFFELRYLVSPAAVPDAGLTQTIPDWLTATQQIGQILEVPSINQLAPTLPRFSRAVPLDNSA